MTDAPVRGTQEGQSRGRDRSTIAFPYSDLDEAASVAKVVFNKGGGSAALDQVAAWLGHEGISSGAFRVKLNSARIFGFVAVERSHVSTTELGQRVADPERAKEARVEAFLTVPLYARIFEKHRGGKLPDIKGIEAEIASLGVTAKQVSRARQTFQRAAEQAGFFDHGRDRLVQPSTNGGNKEIPTPEPTPERQPPGAPTGTQKLHPFVLGLLETLPNPGSLWPVAERQLWLETASHIFGLIYKDKAEQPATE